jgi:hypothetical protein
LSASYYGTLDQGGNVWEWNDERFDLGEPGLRYIGGSNFRNDNPVLSMAAVWGDNSYGVVIGSFRELDRIGFRVATVPEPSSFILAALGLIGLAAYGRRKRRLKMLDPL